MLIPRILTALILALLLAITVLLLPEVPFTAAILLTTGLGCFELFSLIGMKNVYVRLFFVSLYFLSCWMLYWAKVDVSLLIYFCSFVWFLLLPLVFYYPTSSSFFKSRTLNAILGSLLLAGAFFSLIEIRFQEAGVFWILFLFVLTTSVDAGGYFVGRKFGKRPLALLVSPSKTIEGLLGGGGLAILLCCLVLIISKNQGISGYLMILPLIVFSVLGDLLVSVLKRIYGVKNSGNLLPGHGGLLDRIDSIIPVMTLGAGAIIF